MAYPNFKNKHLQEALFHPKDFIRYKEFEKKNFPKRYIIIYQSSAKNYFLRKYKPKKIKEYSIYVHKGIGLIKMAGIGAPNAVTVFEELIALGGRRFLNIGIAGGLQQEGIFLCEKAIRDEGTSYHYIKEGKYSYPDKNLTDKFGRTLEKMKISFMKGITWTIDAPYMETKAEVNHYRKEGVSTVEMETSALFAVAKIRKVKIASAFVVSDVLGEKWDPKFHKINLRKSLNKLVDAGISCLKD
ncbi:MAG: nucleoside phosphorylase [Nanoarchaeota archaeon]